MKKELPSLQLRENSTNLERDSRFKYRRLVHMGYKMISNLFDILCPGPSRWHVLNDVCLQLSKQTNKYWKSLDHSVIKDNYTKLSSTLCLCLKMAKKNTVEKRVCRAILYKGTTNNELSNLMNEYDFTLAAGKARASARRDFTTLKQGEVLVKPKKSFSNINEDTLENAVKFILSESNVVAISYGTKLVKLSKTEIIQLPSLTRKKTRLEIFNDFANFYNDENVISRATMFKLMNHLTSNDEGILTAIDYVTAMLINEPCEMLQEVIDWSICATKQSEMTRLIYSSRHFLKHV